MPRKSPAQQRALNTLRAHTAAAQGRGRSRLPSHAALAREAGVSPLTMHRAVAVLRDQGVVETCHGKGTWVRDVHTTTASAPATAHDTVSSRPLKWEHATAALRRDIACGRYRPGALLPSVKELADIHGVCGHTLRKALRRLLEDGDLEQARTRLRVPLRGTPRKADTIALIVRGDPDGNMLVMSPRFEEHLRTLERECARTGVRLEVYALAPDSSSLLTFSGRRLAPSKLARAGIVLGVHVWQIGMPAGALDPLFEGLLTTNLPVALLAEMYTPETEEIPRRWPGVRVFSLARDRDAGRAVARYLLACGHHHLAYISPIHGAGWSQERADGLTTYCARAGMPDAVTLHALDHEGQTDFLNLMHEQLSGRSDPFAMAGFADSRLSLRYHTPRTGQAITVALEHEAMARGIESLLSDALRRSPATVWVAASDSIALLSLDFLRRQRVRVPGDLSVMGFDDGLEAFRYRLTSFNADGSAAVRAMFDYVLHPPPSRLRNPDVPTVFDGFINERSTVGERTARKKKKRASAPRTL